MLNRSHFIPLLVATLAACGGGGGGGTSPQTTAPITAPAAVAATVGSIVPGPTMTWATAAEQTLTLSVQGADGRPAANAGVRLFTLSRTSPQDGAALEAPVPMSLLDSAVSDASGQVSLTLKRPSHLDEVLVVATLDDTQDQRVLDLAGGQLTAELALKR